MTDKNLVLGVPACTERCAGEGELVLARIHGDRMMSDRIRVSSSDSSLTPQSKADNYHRLFPAFFAFAHLALAAAETAALQAALLFILGFCAGLAPLTFAHLAI
ncbi:MAG: hypothetical protein ACLQU3_20895 [Limisphaerales bacterium]